MNNMMQGSNPGPDELPRCGLAEINLAVPAAREANDTDDTPFMEAEESVLNNQPGMKLVVWKCRKCLNEFPDQNSVAEHFHLMHKLPSQDAAASSLSRFQEWDECDDNFPGESLP